jgi:peptidoglycan/xylan/chitin deacetylase (PgdA/CDA1 family)
MTNADVLVLCYHAVSARWRSALAVTPDALRRQLERVLDRGYEATTFTRAVHDPPAARTVAVTFDDGFRSVRDVALPVLESLGVRATVFVPTALVGGSEPLAWPGLEHAADESDRGELHPLGWQDVAHLAALGWEIGSHTRTHPRLPELDDRALTAELRGSRDDCAAALGRECDAVAYPYGVLDARVVAAAAAAGYRAGASPPGSRFGHPALTWPRIGLYERDERARLAAKLSPGMRRLQRSPRWPPVARVARAVGL